MKIYTKKGDDGTTGLLGGTRLPKHHLRIESYGTVDELNSHIGMLRDLWQEEEHYNMLLEIQDRLFTLGSLLALDPEHAGKMKLPIIGSGDIEVLEKAMDEMDKVLPEMRNFVLPGGHVAVSQAHIARCVCRRAERLVVALAESDSGQAVAIQYLNRLSDYLFVLSRRISQLSGAVEKPWTPRLD
jgi:cob(I)alamin adenosyltransferase